MSKTFASLRYVNYRYWFAATLVASTGTWLQRVAQDWYVLTVLTDHDSTQVGVVTALQFLPIILLSASAGVLADRVPGKRLLQATQAGIGLVSLIIGIVVVTGTGELWHQYALAFVSGTISAFDTPARQAFVGELVPETRWQTPSHSTPPPSTPLASSAPPRPDSSSNGGAWDPSSS